ncbi:MAG: response regulator [Acidobacteria bacterium]|nr:response regulator [Acidobacteriota bacterium]
MNQRLLLVEDEQIQREDYANALRHDGWIVVEARDGAEALKFLLSEVRYAMIVLDLRLGDMHGFSVLDRLRNSGVDAPPVLVVSANVNEEAWRRFVEHKIHGLLPKPVNSQLLAAVVAAIGGGNEAALENAPGMLADPALQYSETLNVYAIDYGDRRGYLYRRRAENDIGVLHRVQPIRRIESISDKTKRRDAALQAHFKSQAQVRMPIAADEPLLVVGRRWNSWYPSFYNVAGGAYAIIGANTKSGSPPGVLIDPGFRSIGVLRTLGVPLGILKTCIVTHNHPDHIGGIFEFIAGRHVLGDSTSIFCSKSVQAVLDTYRGAYTNVREIAHNHVDVIAPYEASDSRRRVVAHPIPTSHFDAGNAEGTFGILADSQVMDHHGQFHTRATTLLLGDTEYDPRENGPNASLFNGIRAALARPDLKVAVLHIGCSQFKEGTGKHLYLPGLTALLKYVDHARRAYLDGAEPLLVLVSEWGLEHASATQIANAFPDGAPVGLVSEFDSSSLVRETIEVLESALSLEKVRLLPADVGLVVGMDSGQVYIDGKLRTAPENVLVEESCEGLIYRKKASSALGA